MISLNARCLILIYLHLASIFYLVTDSGTVDIVNVFLDKIHCRKKGFSDFLKKRKNSYLLLECIVLKYCFMVTEGRIGKEITFGIRNNWVEG